MSTQPYRTLFIGTLEQQSEFSIGGSEVDTTVDMPLLKDGKGRLIIRGTSLAGALIDTARKLFAEDMPQSITSKGKKSQSNEGEQERVEERKEGSLTPSSWILHNAHLMPGCYPDVMVRQQVRINEITGAQEDGGLFDLEVVAHKTEAGAATQWQFLMEVKTWKGDPKDEQLAALSLGHWCEHQAMLGRKIATGMGWFKLKQLQAVRLTTEHAEQWPNATQTPIEAAKALAVNDNVTALTYASSKDWQKAFALAELKPRTWQQIRIPYSLKPGNNGYGLDSYLVGGHNVDDALDAVKEHCITPPGYTLPEEWENEPTAQPVMDANQQPYIPGSSIRGVFAHECWRLLNLEHKSHIQRTDAEQDNLYARLFGTVNDSSQIFFSDARLKEGEQWQAMLLHNHAQDEFIGGVYGNSKFMRCTLVSGELAGEIILSAPEDEMPQRLELLKAAIQMAEHGLLAVGSKQWVDSGWLQWQFDTSAYEQTTNSATAEVANG